MTFITLLTGFLLTELGITEAIIDIDPDEPPEGFFESAGYVGNAIGSMVQLMTFQVDELPMALNLLLFVPFSIAWLYIILTIIVDVIPFT